MKDKCECEQSTCEHESESCKNIAIHIVHTPYGYFDMCTSCMTEMKAYLDSINFKE